MGHEKYIETIEDKDMDFEIRRNPILFSFYLNHRVNAFWNMMIKNPKLFGKVSDYYFVTEFQNIANEHVHFMLWVRDAPIYGYCEKIDIEAFIDNYISCDSNLLDINLVKMQTHHQKKTCKKKKTSTCHFSFPLPPMRQIAILEPLENSNPALRDYKINIT